MKTILETVFACVLGVLVAFLLVQSLDAELALYEQQMGIQPQCAR